MYASHHPCWDAKNRYGLPDVMPMEFNQIKHLFEGIEQKPNEPDYRTKLREVMKDMSKEQKAEIINKYKLGPDSSNNDYKNAYETLKGGI